MLKVLRRHTRYFLSWVATQNCHLENCNKISSQNTFLRVPSLRLKCREYSSCSLNFVTRAGCRIDHPGNFIGKYQYPIDQTKPYSNINFKEGSLVPEELSQRIYEEIADETLESLYTYFDEILEKSTLANVGDVSYGSGVLTIKLGNHGTYVINKQTPNRQIWLSSPTSGPKRYDFINKTWIYRHDGMSMYELLNSEIPLILQLKDINFIISCTYGKSDSK